MKKNATPWFFISLEELEVGIELLHVEKHTIINHTQEIIRIINITSSHSFTRFDYYAYIHERGTPHIARMLAVPS